MEARGAGGQALSRLTDRGTFASNSGRTWLSPEGSQRAGGSNLRPPLRPPTTQKQLPH